MSTIPRCPQGPFPLSTPTWIWPSNRTRAPSEGSDPRSVHLSIPPRGRKQLVLMKRWGAYRKGWGGGRGFQLLDPQGCGEGTVCGLESAGRRTKPRGGFSEKAKVGTGSPGTPPPASFTHTHTHTSSTSSSCAWTTRAPPLPRAPTLPLRPAAPSPSRAGDSHAAKAPSGPIQAGVRGSAGPGGREGGRGIEREEAGRPFACPAHPTACGARLLQLRRDALHPPHVHRWGLRGEKGAGLEGHPAPGRLPTGLAPERTGCAAQGRPWRWSWSWSWSGGGGQGARNGLQVRPRPAGGVVGAARCGAAGTRGRGPEGGRGGERGPGSRSPTARSPRPSPPAARAPG